MAKVHPTNIAIGKNKGHLTTKFKLPEKKTKIIRQSRKKGVLPKRVAFIRSIISEVNDHQFRLPEIQSTKRERLSY